MQFQQYRPVPTESPTRMRVRLRRHETHRTVQRSEFPTAKHRMLKYMGLKWDDVMCCTMWREFKMRSELRKGRRYECKHCLDTVEPGSKQTCSMSSGRCIPTKEFGARSKPPSFMAMASDAVAVDLLSPCLSDQGGVYLCSVYREQSPTKLRRELGTDRLVESKGKDKRRNPAMASVIAIIDSPKFRFYARPGDLGEVRRHAMQVIQSQVGEGGVGTFENWVSGLATRIVYPFTLTEEMKFGLLAILCCVASSRPGRAKDGVVMGGSSHCVFFFGKGGDGKSTIGIRVQKPLVLASRALGLPYRAINTNATGASDAGMRGTRLKDGTVSIGAVGGGDYLMVDEIGASEHSWDGYGQYTTSTGTAIMLGNGDKRCAQFQKVTVAASNHGFVDSCTFSKTAYPTFVVAAASPPSRSEARALDMRISKQKLQAFDDCERAEGLRSGAAKDASPSAVELDDATKAALPFAWASAFCEGKLPSASPKFVWTKEASARMCVFLVSRRKARRMMGVQISILRDWGVDVPQILKQLDVHGECTLMHMAQGVSVLMDIWSGELRPDHARHNQVVKVTARAVNFVMKAYTITTTRSGNFFLKRTKQQSIKYRTAQGEHGVAMDNMLKRKIKTTPLAVGQRAKRMRYSIPFDKLEQQVSEDFDAITTKIMMHVPVNGRGVRRNELVNRVLADLTRTGRRGVDYNDVNDVLISFCGGHSTIRIVKHGTSDADQWVQRRSDE